MTALAPGAAASVPFRADARAIGRLAWPVFVGQVSVLAFATIDTALVARAGADDLAALAVGAATYITVFIGLMGVVMAVSPIVGQLFGAGRHAEAGRHVHQAVWIALGLAVLGSALLAWPTPFLALSRVGPEVAAKVRGYLLALAVSLPASLLFTVWRGFNTAVSRPKAVMALQLGALAVKAPLSAALVFGLPALGLPPLGVTGCGIATATVMWLQLAAAFVLLQRDPFYHRFELRGRGLDRPVASALREHVRLGVPMGASILVEVAGFAFMAIFIARLGTTPVAAHQLVANLSTLMFMMPLALANATSTLVAQAIGAARKPDAQRLARRGLRLGLGLAAATGLAVALARAPLLALYTRDAAVLAQALPLAALMVVFHVIDAAQIIAAFVLRAYKVVVLPLAIYAGALWGIGISGGYWLAFGGSEAVPAALRGAAGFWAANTVGLALAAVALVVLMNAVVRRDGR